MSAEYNRKKIRLKKQWSYISAALKIVQLTQQTEKRRFLLETIMKSDLDIFNRLLDDDLSLVDCPIPVGYNHFNIYQIILERSTETFIGNVLTKYFDIISRSTDNGKLLVPVACERGDENILKLILEHFPCAPLDGISNSTQSCHYLLHHEPCHLLQREIEAYENEIPLASVIRNDRVDLLQVLVKFKSFTLDTLTHQQKQQIFHLCLLAEHRQVTIDKYNIKWFKHQSLRPCGSIECLRFLIESTDFSALDDLPYQSPFILILDPVYLYLIQLYNKQLIDLQTKFHPRLLRALYDLIEKQIQLFTYLITHCAFEPVEADLIRLNECIHYVEEIFHETNEYRPVKRILFRLNTLLNKINEANQNRCLSLKQICRLKIRNCTRKKHCLLVQKLIFLQFL
ncbi:unnamed protein product [Adineta ricciae]|uniref:Uncharacterized protein n=1 Tax=Adineta ricciae TaxID=249248 RepID=A0A813PRR7_ADIRI|nr:unnamed protein product [Adineta ricciae]CAF1078038.1 unnamed protein product [Adineta ricciae]